MFVVSAPSGAGKTTLVQQLVKVVPGLGMSRSYTSRPVRPGEAQAVDYNFVSVERFREMREAGEFLEWAEVFGHCYGTSARDTEGRLADGEDLVLVIDVQGAEKVRQRGVPFVGIFVLPPSFALLESRLRTRSCDTEDQMARRLATARSEVHSIRHYSYVVVNDDLDRAVDRLRAIVLAERLRLEAMEEEVAAIVASFAGRADGS